MTLDHKWIPRILSLIAAIVLWIFVMNEQNPLAERTLTLPVSVQNLNTESQIVINSIPNAQVKIRAPRLQLAEFNDSDLKAYVDLGNLAVGKHSLPLKISTPSGVEVVEVSTPYVEVMLDSLITQQVPIVVDTEGVLGKDVQILNKRTVPSVILATGPASERSSANEARVVVNINDIHESFTTEAIPILGDRTKLSAHWTFSPQKVMAYVEIGPKENKLVEVQLQTIGSLPEGLTLSSNEIVPSAIRIQGNSATLSRIESIKTNPLDLSKVFDNAEYELNLEVPADISVDQEKVKVSVQVTKSEATP